MGINAPRVPAGGQPADPPVTHALVDNRSAALARLDTIKSKPISVRLAPPRRDAGRRLALHTRIVGEFREMPGMALTAPQAARLFGLGQDACVRILDELVHEGVLCRTDSGRWRLELAAPAERQAG